MLYAVHEAACRSAAPLQLAAQTARAFWGSAMNPAASSDIGRRLYASADVLANLTRRYFKPAWGIDQAVVDGATVPVTCETTLATPWVTIRRFRCPRPDRGSKTPPKLLLVAPLSGHYATLLRGTVQTFLADFDVHVADWANARDVSILRGRFGFHDYVDTIIQTLEAIGPRAHVVAVCQPGPPVFAAAALMAEDGAAARPASLTLMGSPIDARLSPTAPNRLAEERPFTWFASNMIYTVPPPYLGALRRVYPGFVQLYSFMSMNAEAHQQAHQRYFDQLVEGDGDSAEKHRAFYDEYLSVLDLTEEFYLETVDTSFSSVICWRRARWSTAAGGSTLRR